MADDTGRDDDQGRGDDVYQPEHSDTGNRPDGELDLENVIGERSLDDMMEEGYSPLDRPLVVGRHGTTGEELRRGETLEQRLAQELPETSGQDGDGIGDLAGGDGEPLDGESGRARAGRLAAVDDIAPRRHNDVVARDVGIDGGAASAEEAAMHVVDGEEEDEPERYVPSAADSAPRPPGSTGGPLS
ncbi:DUF5709 domain-containing protein [Streptomyces genisteinicus]|uniref:DUF5709 domain-containing protein n=1 Tax=Streptomyces genisteinicus TaxID=2768068 RepID=UPI001CA70489|nr:DUF5709 domain-containing protein [Streptomyces genisteinicus]